MFNFHSNILEGMFGLRFLRFLSVIIYSFYMISLSPDSGASYDTLNFANVADVFIMNSIPQNIVSNVSQNSPFISKYIGYFYSDVIVKYDGSSTSQIDGKTSRRLFILRYKDTAQRYLDRLADFTDFVVYDSTITRLFSLLLSLWLCFRTLSLSLSLSFCVSSLLSASFIYLNVVLHFRVVGQSLHIIIQSGQIMSFRERQRFLLPLSFVLDATYPDAFMYRLRRL
jgi:hypothetical protein